MNFAKALSRCKDGSRIRRECWDTFVVHTETGLHFMLGAKLALALGTEYEPTETDRGSADWVVAQ
jgi:hypothetical protein